MRAYRDEVDRAVVDALQSLGPERLADIAPLVALGLAHEQQHQELILTDILHAFAQSPLEPAYHAVARPAPRAAPRAFHDIAGGLQWIGVAPATDGDFAFDNEGPRHRVWLEPFAIADHLATVGSMRAFIDAGGYRTPSLWLSAGWDLVRAERLDAPLHTRYRDGAYRTYDLDGWREAADDDAVLHLSWFEADALARFCGARLPTEAEWEVACRAGLLPDAFDTAWQWTRSAYAPYPGYRAAAGAVGEYNGKFMSGQLVLRGASRFTPPGHSRPSYRNFWPAETRFQRTSVRFVKDLS